MARTTIDGDLASVIVRLRRILTVHERMFDRVRGNEILERAATIFHGRNSTADDVRLLQVHSLPHSVYLRRHAAAFRRTIEHTRPWLEQLLPRIALLRPVPRISVDVPGSSAAAAIWTTASDLANAIDLTRRRAQPAECGTSRIGDRLVEHQSKDQRWEYEVRRQGWLDQTQDPRVQARDVSPSKAANLYDNVVHEVASAPICWPDLAQALALNARRFTSSTLAQVRHELLYEQALVASATTLDVRPTDVQATSATTEAASLNADQAINDPTTALQDTLPCDGVICNHGSMWTIRLPGLPEVHVRNSLGIKYLALLVVNRGREIHATRLVGLASGTAVPDTLFIPISDDAREAIVPVGRDPVLDEPATRNLAGAIEQLQEQIASANAIGDGATAAERQEELEAIEKQLKSATARGGRPRNFAAEGDRDRKSVRAALDRLFDEIRRQDQATARYVETSVHTGLRCAFRAPDEPCLRVIRRSG